MNIDAFINNTVQAHNRTCSDFIISKTCRPGCESYFLYLKNYDIWGIEEWFLYKFIYDKLSQDEIFPKVLMREIGGKTKIGIAFDVKS